MGKRTLFTLTTAIMTGGLLFAMAGYAAFNSPEQIGLQDFIQIHQQQKDKNLAGDSFSAAQLSEFSIAIDATATAEQIQAYSDASFKKLLQPTNERLWFVMINGAPEGILIANDKKPVKMGGKNRSKDLLKLYHSARGLAANDEQVRYVEFEGQGLLLVLSGEAESVFLSQGLASLLQLPEGQVQPREVIAKMKARIAPTSAQQE
ncbi:hypothetical protein QJ48_21850 [Paenibacillus sp. A3]|uniref:hypothetical protein n=1 Tax=Paenibacillus sp. A3 TaxID=1337054 RepID=UPI0006E4DA5A|nr:hypothetical protein [Paenibacillus sp. A3]KPV57455.1 hypothetical protein QJ48_21850 [Paenibacillus sp. A3]